MPVLARHVIEHRSELERPVLALATVREVEDPELLRQLLAILERLDLPGTPDEGPRL